MYITFNNKSITEQEIDINYYNKMPTKKIKLVCIEICDDCNIKHSVKIEAQCKNYKNNFNSVIISLQNFGGSVCGAIIYNQILDVRVGYRV